MCIYNPRLENHKRQTKKKEKKVAQRGIECTIGGCQVGHFAIR